jgi:hypothetical protein
MSDSVSAVQATFVKAVMQIEVFSHLAMGLQTYANPLMMLAVLSHLAMPLETHANPAMLLSEDSKGEVNVSTD